MNSNGYSFVIIGILGMYTIWPFSVKIKILYPGFIGQFGCIQILMRIIGEPIFKSSFCGGTGGRSDGF